MKRHHAYRYEMIPESQQDARMHRVADVHRYLYNVGLRTQIDNYKAGNKYIRKNDMIKKTADWRKDAAKPWAAEIHSQVAQQVMVDLHDAFERFFNGQNKFPKFKKRGSSNKSFRYTNQGLKIDQGNARIYFPLIGWVRIRLSRKIVGRVLSATISHKAGKWFVSVLTEHEVPDAPPVPVATGAIGLDMGIANFVMQSDGKCYASVDALKKHKVKLVRYQRKMARQQKGSNNRAKTKGKIQKLYAHMANIRKDNAHKVSTEIANNYAMVAIEDLKIKNMSKSARGTKKKPGKNVRAKAGLNRAILDQGWGMFRTYLKYKLERNGGMLVAVKPHYTSQTCPDCGCISAKNRQTQAEFVCVDCGYTNHADVVGAMNVLARGHSVLACGEDIRRDCRTGEHAALLKQEPTEGADLTTLGNGLNQLPVGIPVL